MPRLTVLPVARFAAELQILQPMTADDAIVDVRFQSRNNIIGFELRLNCRNRDRPAVRWERTLLRTGLRWQ